MTLFLGIDTETTGLEYGDHRFVEVCANLYRDDGSRAFGRTFRIDPQRAIAVDAQRVHGISLQELAGKPTWEVIGPTVHAIMSKATHIFWHNGKWFDGPFLKYEFERIGLTMPDLPSTDTMADALWATHDGKKPTLEELCFACGVPYDKALAHAAEYDVDRMAECFFKARQWGYFQPPALAA